MKVEDKWKEQIPTLNDLLRVSSQVLTTGEYSINSVIYNTLIDKNKEMLEWKETIPVTVMLI